MSTSISEDLVRWILSMIFDLMYSSLMSQSHAGHWSSAAASRFLMELLTAWNDNLPLRASPTSKSNEIVLLEISLQSIRLALGSDCTFKQHCLPARPPRLPAVKEANKNNQNQTEKRQGKLPAPTQTNTPGPFILRVISYPKHFKTPLWVRSSNESVPLRSAGETSLAGKSQWSSL